MTSTVDDVMSEVYTYQKIAMRMSNKNEAIQNISKYKMNHYHTFKYQ